MLTGAAIREARKALGLDQKQAARLWQVGYRTWQRWEEDETAMRGPAALLLRACIDFPPLLTWLREREEED